MDDLIKQLEEGKKKVRLDVTTEELAILLTTLAFEASILADPIKAKERIDLRTNLISQIGRIV